MVLTKKTEDRKEGRGRRLSVEREGKEDRRKRRRHERLWETRVVAHLVFKLMCNVFWSSH